MGQGTRSVNRLRTAARALAASVLAIAALRAHAVEPPLNRAVLDLVRSANLKGASAAISVVEVKSGRILCGIDDGRLVTPASNLKIITTGCALLLLGDQFQFTTTIYASGAIDARGSLDGDLVVAAGGDPAISGREHDGKTTAVFDAWAAEIARSIRSVSGSLLIDDTIFDRQYVHPSWPRDQLTRWYCAPVSAFALNDNCIDVTVRPGAKPGDLALVALDPPTSYFRVQNTCRTIPSGKARAVISRLPDADTLEVSGQLTPKSAGAAAPVAVANPTLFAATVLRERLAAAGVTIAGRIALADKPIDTARMRRLASTSHSLASAVRTANKRSQNFYAEMILKTLGRRVATPASFESGVRGISPVLEKLGMKPGSCTIEDGSGLSPRNALTALQLAWFLRVMALSACADTFVASLPIAGKDGTLERRMTDPPCAGAVLAKTGHLRHVSALSGYLKTTDRWLAFSIPVEGAALDLAAADALQDSICAFLAKTDIPK